MAKNKPLKDEEYDSIDEIQTTLDRHTDKLNRIEAGLVSIKSEIASVSKTGGHNMDSSGDRQFIQLRNLFYDILAYIIHSGFISGYQNRYGDNLKPPTNVYHRMTA